MSELAQVLRELEGVRQSGAVNMMDRTGVLFAAENMEYDALTEWLHDHTAREYLDLLMGDHMGRRLK